MTSNSTPLPRWDLTEYYSGATDPLIDADLAEDLANAQAFEAKYKGRIASLSADELAAAIREMEGLFTRPRDPARYVSLMKSIHLDDEAIGALGAKIREKGAKTGKHRMFWELELKKLEPAKVEEMMQQSPALAHYKPYLSEVLREAPHTLSDEVELALQKRAPASARGTLNRLYGEVRSKLRFPFPDALLDEEDRTRIAAREGAAKKDGISMLTETEVRGYWSGNANEAARKAAYESMIKTYDENTYHPAFIMNASILAKQIEDEERGFARPDSSRNLANDVEPEVVDTLVSTVKANYPKFGHRFAKLKAQVFGEEILSPWNDLAPAPEVKETTVTWDEARDLVLESFREFSPRMAEIAQMFFDKGWIDAEPRPGKQGGAFSASNRAASHPFVMVNFLGKIDDVMTLAHELGHGVHQYLAAQKQGDLMDGTSLTFAETASTFAETVVFNKLLSRISSPEEKKKLLVNKLTDAASVTERQIAYHDFETKIHAARKNGEIPVAKFGEYWLESHAERHGGNIATLEGDKGHRWGSIPHFFNSPFYVYSYAFGDLLAASLYEKFKEMKAEGKGAEFEEKYLDLLAAASTKHHSEMLQSRFGADFDATKPEFWQRGLNVYNGMVDELEQLMAQEKATAQVQAVSHEGMADPAAGKSVA